MKIVLSFDSFKGGMSAQQACIVAEAAIRKTYPRADVESIPLADGGEGTAEILRSALDGRWISVETMGPLPDMQVNSGFVWVPDRKLAIVEMASSSGLPLLPHSKRNPLLTTTFGTGQLLAAALKTGAQEIWLTVGGSATVDGGVGAAMALGWRFTDRNGCSIGLGGAALKRLHHIERSTNSHFPPCRVLCDVTHPLLGPTGAARVFGPQKGASLEMVNELEAGLQRLAEVAKQQFETDLALLPGGGAAGGLAAGAHLFFGAVLVSGIDAVLKAVGYDERIQGADWIITGEGCLDDQSLHGKVVSGVLNAAGSVGAQVAVLAGSVKLSRKAWEQAGIHYAAALAPADMAPDEAIAREREFLALRVKEFLLRACE